LVGRSTCSDRALRPNKRMNASRSRLARFARSRLLPAALSVKWGHPLKGESREKTPLHGKKISFLFGSDARTSSASFSSLLTPVTSSLIGSGHYLTRTSHPSGSRLLLCLKQGFKHSPWSNQSDPRKSSVPYRVQ